MVVKSKPRKHLSLQHKGIGMFSDFVMANLQAENEKRPYLAETGWSVGPVRYYPDKPREVRCHLTGNRFVYWFILKYVAVC